MTTWGNSNTNGGTEATWFTNSCRALRGTFPNVADATLVSVSINLRRASASLDRVFRLAVYTGGTSDTDPTGATLLEDLGELSTGTGASADVLTTYTANSVSSPTIPANTRVWLFGKHNFASLSMRTGNTRTTELSTGWRNVVGMASNSSGTAFESTVPSVTTGGSDTTQEFSWWLDYTIGGGGTVFRQWFAL